MSPARSEQVKTRSTGWWTPPEGTPLYAPIPYVAPIVEDALSITEYRVLRTITSTTKGAKRSDGNERGFLCDPGGYDRIAKNAGVCRKTAYNCVKSLIDKKALRVWKIEAHGGQRVKTLYFAPHYQDVFALWRADPSIFKTERGSVVVRGRAKAIQSEADAADWKIDSKRAPKRGCGRARKPEELEQEARFEEKFEQAAEDLKKTQATAPPPPPPMPAWASDEELNAVRESLIRVCPSNLQDVIDVLARARQEAERLAWQVLPVAVVTMLIERIAREYKPNRQFPILKPKWMIDRIGGHVAYWISGEKERLAAEARTPSVNAFGALLSERLGDCVEDYRRITGNADATVEEYLRACDDLVIEFEERKTRATG